MTVSILVNNLDNCFVVHLLEPAMTAQSDSSIPRDFMKVSWVLTMSSDDILHEVYVEFPVGVEQLSNPNSSIRILM